MVIPFVVLFCLLLFSFTAGAAESGTRVVRVGYPIQQGFTEIDENGNYSGYTYDYLPVSYTHLTLPTNSLV